MIEDIERIAKRLVSIPHSKKQNIWLTFRIPCHFLQYLCKCIGRSLKVPIEKHGLGLTPCVTCVLSAFNYEVCNLCIKTPDDFILS